MVKDAKRNGIMRAQKPPKTKKPLQPSMRGAKV